MVFLNTTNDNRNTFSSSSLSCSPFFWFPLVKKGQMSFWKKEFSDKQKGKIIMETIPRLFMVFKNTDCEIQTKKVEREKI